MLPLGLTRGSSSLQQENAQHERPCKFSSPKVTIGTLQERSRRRSTPIVLVQNCFALLKLTGGVHSSSLQVSFPVVQWARLFMSYKL